MERDGLATKAQGSHHSHVPYDSVMSVGSSSQGDAERIRELEEEVKQLAERANNASQKYADYENEIRVLEAKLRQEQRKHSTPITDGSNSTAYAAQRPGISRFGSFMGTRVAATSTPDGPLPSATSREQELEARLVKEQTMRIAAEQKVKEVSAEIEDLSATLFQQANDMVATERKQNAELKEKVQVLEEQQQQIGSTDAEKLRKENKRLREKLLGLEQRDAERKRRLERLEAANKRIDRIRTMLHPP